MSDLNSFTDNELEAEISRREVAKRQAKKPKLIENPDLSKLVKMCQAFVDYMESDEYYEDNDFDKYIFEMAMKTFFGDDFFDWFNERD